MHIRSRRPSVIAAMGLVLVVASCDKSPTKPGPGGPANISRIDLVAPPDIAPGEAVQLTVNAVKTDGSVENVTARSQWTSSTSEVLQISPAGLAMGKERGEALVTAQFEGRSASARIFVLPKGTFRLAGRVTDKGAGIDGVAVAVISGIGAGLRTASGPDGAYSLYGVSGDVTIQVEKIGYTTGIYQLEVTAHRAYDIAVVPLAGTRIGTYAFTVFTGSCIETFPDAAKRRVYTAEVSKEPNQFGGDNLYFSLSGGNFIVTNGYGNNFRGFISPRDAIVDLTRSDDYYYGPREYQLVERFNDTALVILGTGWGKGTLEFASGPFFGEILIFEELRAPFTSIKSRCKTDRFELVRR